MKVFLLLDKKVAHLVNHDTSNITNSREHVLVVLVSQQADSASVLVSQCCLKWKENLKHQTTLNVHKRFYINSIKDEQDRIILHLSLNGLISVHDETTLHI